jgi:hypothetical protein
MGAREPLRSREASVSPRATSEPPGPGPTLRARLLGAAKYWADKLVIAPAGGVVLLLVTPLLSGNGKGEAPVNPAPQPPALSANVTYSPAGVFTLVDGRPERHGALNLGPTISFNGYCIGPPRPGPEHTLPDSRWFILGGSEVVSAVDLDPTSAKGHQPLPCPEAGPSGSSSGWSPTRIDLRYEDVRGRLRLGATSSKATLIGFAVFPRGSRHWRPVALKATRSSITSVSRRDPGQGLVIAAACWGPEAPAHPSGPAAFVEQVRILDGAPPGSYRLAAKQTAEGVGVACTGPHPPARRRKQSFTPATSSPTPTSPYQTNTSQMTIAPSPPASTTPTPAALGRSASARKRESSEAAAQE